jgi:hypothetical protein
VDLLQLQAANTENWNGTSWTEVNDLNIGRAALAGAGTNTAALGIWWNNDPGVTGATEEWDVATRGAWATGSPLNTARTEFAGAGTQTATLSFWWISNGSANVGLTESYNGTLWSNVASLNTARRVLAGAGNNTAALAFGGFATANVGNNESYNGQLGQN